jgi:hypothetical protein
MLFVLHTLWLHGLYNYSIQAIVQTTVVATMVYAPPARWGFANTTDCNHLKTFLRHVVQFNYLVHPADSSQYLL